MRRRRVDARCVALFGWRDEEMMLKTSQAMGRVRQGVGDESVTHRRRVGDTSATHRRRVGFASTTRRVGVALSARRLRVCKAFTIRRQGIGEASASCLLRVGNAFMSATSRRRVHNIRQNLFLGLKTIQSCNSKCHVRGQTFICTKFA